MDPFADVVKIGMPNVLWNNVGSSSGENYDIAVWTQYFLGNCTNSGTSCHFDFAAIHYYQDCDPLMARAEQFDSKEMSRMHRRH